MVRCELLGTDESCIVGRSTHAEDASAQIARMNAEAEQEHARQLEIEFGQLQLELSTWATSPRIEKIARDKLKMRTPETVKMIAALPGGGAR